MGELFVQGKQALQDGILQIHQTKNMMPKDILDYKLATNLRLTCVLIRR